MPRARRTPATRMVRTRPERQQASPVLVSGRSEQARKVKNDGYRILLPYAGSDIPATRYLIQKVT